jgi:hypothetical protein
MNATPRDESMPVRTAPAGSLFDRDDGRGGTPADPPVPSAAASPDDDGEPDDDGAPAGPDRAGPDRTAPAPSRAGPVPLPRRTHRRRGNGEPDAAPRRSPDGRPYSAPDETTLSRLLRGLRGI